MGVRRWGGSDKKKAKRKLQIDKKERERERDGERERIICKKDKGNVFREIENMHKERDS